MPNNKENGGAAVPHHAAITAWLNHLRLIAEMPYPGWVLMPTLMTLTCAYRRDGVQLHVARPGQ